VLVGKLIYAAIVYEATSKNNTEPSDRNERASRTSTTSL
jgi:hypothetical protein